MFSSCVLVNTPMLFVFIVRNACPTSQTLDVDFEQPYG
jgi:hypothetical protein